MRKWILAAVCFAALGALIASESEAARLGGGRSIGAQRSVTRAPSSVPARPAQQQQAAPAQGAAQPAPSGLSRWMPLLGGLALGGLLGSLFGGNGFGGIVLLVLLALGAVMVVKAFARRGAAPQPIQYAGMGMDKLAFPQPPQAAAAPAKVPAGFDTVSFLKGAKLNFVKLQVANDLGKLDEIREFTTTEMFDELSREAPPPGQHTDVVALNADLLEVETEGDRHWASVRFSGTVRDAQGAAPEGFEEVWNLVKPADGSTGWLLAGIQQMH